VVILDTDHVSVLEWVTSPERRKLVNRLEKLVAEEITTTFR
jgi:antibiotic biosynthesis monooxygenase (ABM) superfamily enzyme